MIKIISVFFSFLILGCVNQTSLKNELQKDSQKEDNNDLVLYMRSPYGCFYKYEISEENTVNLFYGIASNSDSIKFEVKSEIFSRSYFFDNNVKTQLNNIIDSLSFLENKTKTKRNKRDAFYFEIFLNEDRKVDQFGAKPALYATIEELLSRNDTLRNIMINKYCELGIRPTMSDTQLNHKNTNTISK